MGHVFGKGVQFSGTLTQHFDQPRVVDGNCSRGGQRFQQYQIRLVETINCCISHLERANHAFPNLQRNTEDRTQLQSGFLVHALEVTLVSPYVRHDQALAIAYYPADDSLTQRQPPAAHNLLLGASGLPAYQLIHPWLEQPDRAGHDVQQTAHFFQDGN